jgi:hypothetical protein
VKKIGREQKKCEHLRDCQSNVLSIVSTALYSGYRGRNGDYRDEAVLKETENGIRVARAQNHHFSAARQPTLPVTSGDNATV